MTLTQAVSSVLGQYAVFRGRARRAEFWWWNLFTLLVGLTVATAEVTLGIGGEASGPVSTLLALVLVLPNVSVSIRRLHDSSRSGWWMLVALVPFVGLVVLLFFFLAPSTTGWNAHGPDPRTTADLEPSDEEARRDELGGGASAPVTVEVTDATWTPPGWDLPSAAEPEAGRPVQDRGRLGEDPDPDRPPA